MIGVLQIATLVAIVLNGLDLSNGSLHLNTERLLLPFVVVGLAIKFLSRDRIYLSAPTRYYAVFLLSAVLSAIVAGLMDHVNGLIVTIAPFFYFLLFAQPGLFRRGLQYAIEGALWYLAVCSILAFLIIGKMGHTFTLVPNAIDTSNRVALTMMEPNILGATIGIFLVIHLSNLQFSKRKIALTLLSLIALIMTGSKVPYLAFLVGVIFLLIRSGAWRGATSILVTFGGVAIAGVGAVLFSGKLYDFYVTMLDRPDAINNRMFALTIGWQRFLEHPIFGNGPLDFARYNQTILTYMGSDNARNMWIWQIWVAVLHDEGLIGFVVFVFFLIAVWWRGQRMVRLGRREYIGYLAAMLVTLIADQTTTTHLSAIFGVLLGLVCSQPVAERAMRKVGQRSPAVGAVGPRLI